MKKLNILIFVLIFLFCISGQSYSQRLVYYNQVTKSTEKPKICPNCSRFGHIFTSWGLTIPSNSENVRIKTLQSSFKSVGYRQMFRISQYFSTGFTIDLNRNSFGIVQIDGKNVHDSILHKKEKFKLNYTDVSWFLRIQFQKRRGMYIGNFIDLGGFAGYSFSKTRYTKNIDAFEIKQKKWYKNVPYINDFHYGLNARLGMNRYVLFAKYRLSDLFDPKTGFAQLPPLSIGLEIGIHR